MWIEQPPSWFRWLFPDVIFRLPGNKHKPGVVFITFDDGPIPEATPRVLDILDEFDVKATFFMVGQNIERYPELLQEVKRRGHLAANHSLHHIRGLGISPEAYRKDVDDCEKYTRSRIFRPSHGYLTPGQLKELKKYYRIIMFDVVTRDYSKRISAEDVVINVKRYTRDGSIIVFHDSLKSIDKLTTALPESLRWLKDRGYSFKKLDDPEISDSKKDSDCNDKGT